MPQKRVLRQILKWRSGGSLLGTLGEGERVPIYQERKEQRLNKEHFIQPATTVGAWNVPHRGAGEQNRIQERGRRGSGALAPAPSGLCRVLAEGPFHLWRKRSGRGAEPAAKGSREN